jgi:ribonuclease G
LANELIVSSTDEGLKIAILENKLLAEIHFEKKENFYSVGDVFWGKIQSIKQENNAAFVTIGHPKAGYLLYTDLGPQIRSQLRFLKSITTAKDRTLTIDQLKPLPDIDKNGNITEVLKVGQPILVQILKEAIQSKGPRLSAQISLAGQYLILLPFGSDVAVSRKFNSHDEKKRVKQLLAGLRPAQMGIIVRTAAEGVEFDRLKEDLDRLLKRWEQLTEALALGPAPNTKLLSEADRTSTILRDMLSIGFDSIYTDDEQIFRDISAYLHQHQPDQKKNLQLRPYKAGIFEAFGIDKQIKNSFGRTIPLTNGAYLVCEHTEALHVFDVNSGSWRYQGGSQEENTLQINLDAAREVARQLRLRDMGGIIVVDFIDQKDPENRRKIYQKLKEEMARDRARHTILPMSKFGLIQITRQRVRPEVKISIDDACPACEGTGKVRPTVLVTDRIMSSVKLLLDNKQVKQLRITCHPLAAAWLTKGWRSPQMQWFFQYFKWVRVQGLDACTINEAHYFDENGQEIKLEG